ncbi:MAG: hypothetical protein GC189_08970 [Alphaproteobacteria bacterium]|nr:hypothetical protein [Alphaproteobacteria bacterium]
MGARAILDRDHFGAMTGDDAALQAEIVALFRAQAELWMRLLVVDAPVQTWRDAAHTLKGSARGLGLWALADACERAEWLGRSGETDGREIAAGLAQARAALAEALAALPRPDAAND